MVGNLRHGFTTHDFTLDLPFRPPAGAPIATLTVNQLHVPDNGLGAGEIALAIFQTRPDTRTHIEADGIELPPSQTWPLGPRIAHLDGTATLTATPQAPAPLATLVRAWQSANGELQVSQANLRWGALDAAVTGTARLDANLQPTASGHAVLTGYAQALDALAARRVMSNDAAFAAKAVLSLVAQSPPGGGPPAVDAPFSLRDLVFYVGPIPLTSVTTDRVECKLTRPRSPAPPLTAKHASSQATHLVIARRAQRAVAIQAYSPERFPTVPFLSTPTADPAPAPHSEPR